MLHSCDLCNYKAMFPYQLNQHVELVHDGKKAFSCKYCETLFGRKYSLLKHIRLFHEPTATDRSHGSNDNNSQMDVTTTSSIQCQKNKLFRCNICNSKFASNRNLKYHIDRQHEKKKPFSCYLCGDAFSSDRNVKKHITAIHDRKKPYKCDTCDKKFAQKVNLASHCKRMHWWNRSSIITQYLHQFVFYMWLDFSTKCL